MLRRQSDKALSDPKNLFSIFISDEGDKLSYIVTSKLKNASAKTLIGMVNDKFEGRGGGREDFAQGGSQVLNDLSDRFASLAEELKKIFK